MSFLIRSSYSSFSPSSLYTASRTFSSSRTTSFARMTLLGRIGNDISTSKSASSGTPYISYSLAVPSGREKETGNEKTSWFRVAVFDEKQIEFMTTYVKKGRFVLVEASATMNDYIPEGEEKKQPRLSLVQDSITFTPKNKKLAEETEQVEA